VGGGLAEVTALVGLSADGTIRVATANDCARREIIALSAHVIAAWNGVARQIRGPEARHLEAWVARDFHAQGASSQGSGSPAPRGATPAPRDPSEAALGRARSEAQGVGDAVVRERLARIRARVLDRERERERDRDRDRDRSGAPEGEGAAAGAGEGAASGPDAPSRGGRASDPAGDRGGLADSLARAGRGPRDGAGDDER
jgi:hypothetical protein